MNKIQRAQNLSGPLKNLACRKRRQLESSERRFAQMKFLKADYLMKKKKRKKKAKPLLQLQLSKNITYIISILQTFCQILTDTYFTRPLLVAA